MSVEIWADTYPDLTALKHAGRDEVVTDICLTALELVGRDMGRHLPDLTTPKHAGRDEVVADICLTALELVGRDMGRHLP